MGMPTRCDTCGTVCGAQCEKVHGDWLCDTCEAFFERTGVKV